MNGSSGNDRVEEMRRTVEEFKRSEFRNITGLNTTQMRALLDGELIPVKVSGRKKFQLWKREDIESGKLERLNHAIRAENRRIRRENDRVRAESWENVSRSLQGVMSREDYQDFQQTVGRIGVILMDLPENQE